MVFNKYTLRSVTMSGHVKYKRATPEEMANFSFLIIKLRKNTGFVVNYTVNSVTGTGHAKYKRSFPTCKIPEDSACTNRSRKSNFRAVQNCVSEHSVGSVPAFLCFLI